MKLIVQIPVLDEADTIAAVIRDIPREIEGVERVEVLIVDDGCTDDTVAIAWANGADHVVRHTGRKGLARAFQTGLDAALRLGADIIVNTDGDHQYPGGEIPRLIAPILSITAEEVWARLPGSREESVHVALFPPDTSRWRDEELEQRWEQLLEVRAAVYAALETARNAKLIGASLTAHVTVGAPPETYDLLTRHEADLPMLFIVSSAAIERRDTGSDVQVDVRRASGEKCPRCWRFVSDAAPEGDLAGLCARCQPGLAVGVVVAQVRHAELAGAAVVGVLAAGVALRLPEQRQQVPVAPAGQPGFGPAVVVGAMAADIGHGVDR